MIHFKDALEALEGPSGATPEVVRSAFRSMLGGSWSPAQIAGFAVALRVRGETGPVISAAAATLREHMIPLVHQKSAVLDTCGTGGDGQGSLNISTGAAIIAAAAGAPVTKHGNRAVSSRSGSADVLEALGVRIDLGTEEEASVLERAGITFLFAQLHHPTLKHVAPTRRELGVRTIFNCLGPLVSPARATHQLVGAYADGLRSLMAEALRDLGTQRAWLVRSVDGMDELSPFAATKITILDAGRISEDVLTPEDFGLEPSPAGATAGGDAADNARILRAILSGEAHAARSAVLLNAAAALCVFFGDRPGEARARAEAALGSGAALATLEKWIEASQAP